MHCEFCSQLSPEILLKEMPTAKCVDFLFAGLDNVVDLSFVMFKLPATV